jgi:hypothetical protein
MLTFQKDWSWLFDKISRLRNSKATKAEVRSIAIATSSTSWRNHATYLYIPEAQNSAEFSGSQIIKPIALLTKTVSLNNLNDLNSIKSAVSDWGQTGPLEEISINEMEEFQVFFYGSHNRFGVLPVWSFEFAQRTQSLAVPTGPFISIEHPVYESIAQAASIWLSDPALNPNPAYTNLCLLRSSKAVIKDLNNDAEGKFIVQIEAVNNFNALYLKLNCTNSDGLNSQTKRADAKVVFDVPSELDEVSLYLIDEKSEPHDYFFESKRTTTWSTSVVRHRGMRVYRDLLNLIHQGENSSVEFKAWLPPSPDDKKFWELHETVVAFANTLGGTILVGVNDHGEIINMHQNLKKLYGKIHGDNIAKLLDVYQTDLKRSIRNETDFDGDISFRQLDTGEQQVLAIDIAPGKSTPYSIISRSEIFVRRGASNIKPPKKELEQMFQSRRPGLSIL